MTAEIQMSSTAASEFYSSPGVVAETVFRLGYGHTDIFREANMGSRIRTNRIEF
jgi:hypothetical protein